MSSIEQLRDQVAKIGNRMVRCSENCSGILHDQKQGILPRGLYLEEEGRTKGRGVIICGLNPGNADRKSMEFYRPRSATYLTFCRFWSEQRLRDYPYFAKLRSLADALELGGPILWTNLAKCQNKSISEKLSIKIHPQTFRRCSARYLAEELKHCPNDWPILAAGRDAYNALLYLCPTRTLIGVPHPTGPHARTMFARMLIGKAELLPSLCQAAVRCLGQDSAEVLWLNPNDDDRSA